MQLQRRQDPVDAARPVVHYLAFASGTDTTHNSIYLIELLHENVDWRTCIKHSNIMHKHNICPKASAAHTLVWRVSMTRGTHTKNWGGNLVRSSRKRRMLV